MEVHFSPDVEKKLTDLAPQSGRSAEELLLDVLAGYLDELEKTVKVLDRRYDDLKSGTVKPIPGDELEAYFRSKSAAARRSPPSS